MATKVLSSAEKYCWEIIQDHYDEIPELSISKLAELCHCSISTINRTVQKKGFKGYSEFRFYIKEKPVYEIKGFSAEISAAIAKNEEELSRTITSISVASVEAAVSCLEAASDILIFARGLSIGAATELMRKLELFHKRAVIHDDGGAMAYYAKHAGPDSLIIVLSLSGGREEINQPLAEAKKNGAKILALTASQCSELTSLADISLVGYKSSYEVNYFELDVHSRLPLYILERVLVDAYSIFKKQQIFEKEKLGKISSKS
ncbi:MurR/RpiR family transcriptional regulator [Lactococcus termiticola]|uniref:RpiR family transcriptional regulator n=1 Tax=Lactococcus termiticola TaxID=2169526 RepID=A0A2R5HIR9_9LACT|nr:MurR/RpiR family transcriptional regulator [Lactococcus termiticola]GBG95971.1 RpiR family transcriptional regulator [Lactococcus termiticola]